MVRRPGLEPGCLSALEPKSSASTNSATLAAPAVLTRREFYRSRPILSAQHCAIPLKNNENVSRPLRELPGRFGLLPRPLRPAVAAIYGFARTADDFADEGDLPALERLATLDALPSRPRADRRGPQHQHSPVLVRLAAVIAEHSLPLQPFHDLLDAFSQDVVKQRYASFDEVLDYCRRSANPVGLLMLHLFGAAGTRNVQRSDAICTALQLIELLAGRRARLGEGPRVPPARRPRPFRRERGAHRAGRMPTTPGAGSCRSKYRARARC